MMFLQKLMQTEQKFLGNRFLSMGCIDEIDVLIYQSDAFECMIAWQGAQLLHWQPAGQVPIVFTSPESSFVKGVPIRGGIPVCWPWFGRRNTPMHGFARLLPWQIKTLHATESNLEVIFSLTHSEATQKYTKATFNLELALSVSAKACELSLVHDADERIEVTAALHSYFMVGDIRQTAVANLGHHFFNALTQTYEKVADPRFFNQALDGYYSAPRDISIIADSVHRRKLYIEHMASNVVLWNPWNALSDLSIESSDHMLCVESAYIDHAMAKGTILGQKITYQSGEDCDEIA